MSEVCGLRVKKQIIGSLSGHVAETSLLTVVVLTCSPLLWRAEGTVAHSVCRLDAEVVGGATAQTLDGAGGIHGVAVQHIPLVCLCTAHIPHCSFAGIPGQHN